MEDKIVMIHDFSLSNERIDGERECVCVCETKKFPK